MQKKNKFEKIQESFTIKCGKCNSKKVELYPASYEGLVGLRCVECGNTFTSY